MQFAQTKVADQVAPLEARQKQLEDEYINNNNALKQKQAEGFSDDSEEVQTFARNMQTIETAHISVTAQLAEAKAAAKGATKDQKANMPIPVEVLPETTDEEVSDEVTA